MALKPFPTFTPNTGIEFVVGDLYKTEMTLTRYDAGEIFKINNILAGSYLKQISETITETEAIERTESETTTERMQSASSSSQEMMREAAQSSQSNSQSVDVGGEAAGAYGKITFSAYGDYNNSRSKQKSRETAREVATAVVSQSQERTTSRILSEVSTRRTVTDTRTQEAGFDNRGGGHVAGITRNVDEVYRVDLLNFSKHLFANILIANPAAHYRAYMEQPGGTAPAQKTTSPQLVYQGALLDVEDMTRDSWLKYSSYFNIKEAFPPPEEWISVSGNVDFQSPSRPDPGHDSILTALTVPEGYIPKKLNVASGWVQPGPNRHLAIFVGGFHEVMTADPNVRAPQLTMDLTDSGNNPPSLALRPLMGGQGGTLDIGVTAANMYEVGVTFDLQCQCTEDSSYFKLWQFDLYQALLAAANGGEDPAPITEAVDNIGVAKVDYTNSAGLARDFVLKSIKRSVLQQVLGTDLEGFEVLDAKPVWPKYPMVNTEKMKRLAPIVQFLSTVFDYDKMTIKYVDGFIGDVDNRVTAYQGLRPGPMKDFLEATFARVTLPIARFDDNEFRFRWFMETGEVFIGDDVPIIDDELSMAILNELHGTEAVSAENAELVDSWEITMPSAHTILQAGASLPDFSDPDSLPGLVTTTQPTRSDAGEPE